MSYLNRSYESHYLKTFEGNLFNIEKGTFEILLLPIEIKT